MGGAAPSWEAEQGPKGPEDVLVADDKRMACVPSQSPTDHPSGDGPPPSDGHCTTGTPSTEGRVVKKSETSYLISMGLEVITLPPVQDILLLGKKCPQGKTGLSECLDLLAPDDFELVDIDDENVEAMLVNRRLLKMMPLPKIMAVLREKVFPLVSQGDTVKVDFRVRVSYPEFVVEIDD